MNQKQAQYLEAVCRTGSISGAAAELYISRTAISHSLRELEEEFNTVLFDRTRSGIELTSAGEILREHCRQLKASYNLTRDKIDALRAEETQAYLKIAFTTTAGTRLFPEFFMAFRKRCPDITCTITEMSAFDTIDGVREGVVDLAVTPVSLQREGCQNIGKIFLHKLGSVICVSKDDPLCNEPFLTREQIEKRPFATPANQNPLPFPVNIIMRVNQTELIHKVVANGIALSILPVDQVQGWDDVACIPFQEPMINDVHLIWNKSTPHARAFYRFLDFVKNYDITRLERY